MEITRGEVSSKILLIYAKKYDTEAVDRPRGDPVEKREFLSTVLRAFSTRFTKRSHRFTHKLVLFKYIPSFYSHVTYE